MNHASKSFSQFFSLSVGDPKLGLDEALAWRSPKNMKIHMDSSGNSWGVVRLEGKTRGTEKQKQVFFELS